MLHLGGRQADDIVRWLLKRTGPPATDLAEVDQAKTFIGSSEVVVVGFFEDKESAGAKALVAAADSYDDLPFGITSSKDVAEALEAQMDTVVVFKKVSVMPGSAVHNTIHKSIRQMNRYMELTFYSVSAELGLV